MWARLALNTWSYSSTSRTLELEVYTTVSVSCLSQWWNTPTKSSLEHKGLFLSSISRLQFITARAPLLCSIYDNNAELRRWWGFSIRQPRPPDPSFSSCLSVRLSFLHSLTAPVGCVLGPVLDSAWLPWILLSGATVAHKLTVQMPPIPGASVRALRPWGESWVGDHHCPLSAQDSVTSFASCSLVESRDCWITADGNLPHSHEGGLLTDSPVTPLGERAFGHGYGLSARHRDPLVSIESLACSQVLF